MKQIITFVLTLTCCAHSFAQSKKELASTNDAKISYSVSRKEVKFYIKTNGGIPSIEVDVNKNKTIDNMVDRSYGIITKGGLKICPQYKIDYQSSTYCGAAPSNAKLSGKTFDYVFTIPIDELTTPIDRTVIHVGFIVCLPAGDNKCNYSYFPPGIEVFYNLYKIDL